MTLKKARELLLSKSIITDGLEDREKFPIHDPSDPLKGTPRELTLKLVKQHGSLLHKVVALTETLLKQGVAKYAGGCPDIMKEISAEETVSR